MDNQKAFVEDTIKLLNTQGWIQGRFATPQGRCLLGAISLVYSSGKYTADEATEVQTKLLKKIDTFSLTSWNDKPGRTKEEVIALLESV